MTSGDFKEMRNKINRALESEIKFKSVENIFKDIVSKSQSGNIRDIESTSKLLENIKAETQEEIAIEQAVAIVEQTTELDPIKGIDYNVNRITTFIQNNILSHQEFDFPQTRIVFLNEFGKLFDIITYGLLILRFYFEKIKYGEEYEKEIDINKEYKIDASYLVENTDIQLKYAKITVSMFQKLKLLMSMIEQYMSNITEFLKQNSSSKLSTQKTQEYVNPIIIIFKDFNSKLFNYN
jgi:hypothetical protein